MAKSDSGLMSLTDIPAALGLLTRLPIPVDADNAIARGAKAAWAYPLVGLVLALLVGLPAWALSDVVTPAVLAALVLVALIVVTGALHEDGLADTADGLWGGWEPARRLEIMKDSQIGSYGVIALILSLLLRWLGLTAVIEAGLLLPALIAVAMLSRAAMVGVMTALPNARDGGLSKRVGRPEMGAAGLAILLAVVAVLLSIGLSGVTLILVVTGAALAVGAVAKVKIGGQTGDILGATQQISEVATLLTLATILGAA
ncbi:adenosylcobinamide-GDP ribazoletransferase [Cognatishimia sp. MH4019]|uniref:adenosylcobinamide-GDP ribazoletransferase n=1 Tax=Cognatishimia sp. MH4019 TaxID=2854030 RepID=UPI001CD56DEF|nr:adenosylcobinamide-GDP ribazoletransferase [Cognatishimia sp. MH4019]